MEWYKSRARGKHGLQLSQCHSIHQLRTTLSSRLQGIHVRQNAVSDCDLYWRDSGFYAPAEDTEDEVENEEGAENDEADEVQPRPVVAFSIIHLR